jgi:putative addiction module component (TIGR02574 family)
MPNSASEIDIDQLSMPQRLDLIARLWDSIPDSLDAMPVPDWQRQEIEKRLASADAAPEQAIPWEEVRARLRENP